MDNPLEKLANIYKESVEEADKNGYADLFKKCTELFFKSINEEFPNNDNKLTICDIQYLDGYFIFGHGSNSIVHFHITECPGWKFGIWWSQPKVPKCGEGIEIRGEFFAQYEENIDKFKPSASIISENFKVFINDNINYMHCESYGIKGHITFIKTEPYLAFCRDYLYWDYNKEYHTREEAEEEFNKYKKIKEDEAYYTKLYNDKILDFVKANIIPLFEDAQIIDRGENVYPRYEILAPFDKNTDLISEPGAYDLFDDEDEVNNRIHLEFDSLINEAYECANEHNISYFNPISCCVFFK